MSRPRHPRSRISRLRSEDGSPAGWGVFCGALAVFAIGIPLAYWVIGKLPGRNW